MKKLWIVVAVLGLVYLAVWAGVRGDERPVTPRPSPTPDLKTTLSEAARGDAIGRVGSGNTLKVTSAVSQYFALPELVPATLNAPNATPGLIITVVAEAGGKPQAKLIYHAVAPNTVKFVRQEAP